MSGGPGFADELQKRATRRDAAERGERLRVCFACARPDDRVLGWQASDTSPCGRCGKLPSDGTMVEGPGAGAYMAPEQEPGPDTSPAAAWTAAQADIEIPDVVPE